MVDKELLSRKLSRLRSYVDGLKGAEDIDWEKYQSDLRAKTFVERYLHLAIEEVMDIANHLIKICQNTPQLCWGDEWPTLSPGGRGLG